MACEDVAGHTLTNRNTSELLPTADSPTHRYQYNAQPQWKTDGTHTEQHQLELRKASTAATRPNALSCRHQCCFSALCALSIGSALVAGAGWPEVVALLEECVVVCSKCEVSGMWN